MYPGRVRPHCPTSSLGCGLHRGLIPTPLHSSGWEELSQVIQPPEGGGGCPIGPGRGDTELGEPWGRWGTQPRGQVLEISLTSCPASTPAPRPLSAPHITLAAVSVMEELMGKGSTSFTHLLRDAFNLPAHGLSSPTPSSPLMAVKGLGLYLSCWEIFPADMTPCSGQGAGDAHSTQRLGIPRWSCYAQGTSSCTTLPWARHRALDPGVKGFLFAFLES